MIPKPRAYTITDRATEGPCPWCGCSLYVGDRAWQLDETLTGYCAPWCARDDAAAKIKLNSPSEIRLA